MCVPVVGSWILRAKDESSKDSIFMCFYTTFNVCVCVSLQNDVFFNLITCMVPFINDVTDENNLTALKKWLRHS